MERKFVIQSRFINGINMHNWIDLMRAHWFDTKVIQHSKNTKNILFLCTKTVEITATNPSQTVFGYANQKLQKKYQIPKMVEKDFSNSFFSMPFAWWYGDFEYVFFSFFWSRSYHKICNFNTQCAFQKRNSFQIFIYGYCRIRVTIFVSFVHNKSRIFAHFEWCICESGEHNLMFEEFLSLAIFI